MDSIVKRLIQKGSPFELQDAVINGIPCKIFPHGPKTLQDVFIKAASFKQNEFIVDGEVRLTFNQTIEKAKYFAFILKIQYGISKGDRVALLMKNSAEWIIAFIAIHMAGAVSVTIHADSTKETVVEALQITSCKSVICDKANIEKLDAVNLKCSVILFSSIKQDNEMKTDITASPVCEFTKSDPDDEALISFTSGTTGTPKGVVLSHRNMTTGLMNMMLGGYMMSYRAPKKAPGAQANNQNMQPCSILLSPLSHIGGFSSIMLMCYLGGKIVLMNRWDTARAASLIEKEKVRSINGASVDMIRELLRSESTTESLKTLTNLNIHGTALNRNFIKEVTGTIPSMNIGTGYGMTETCGSISNVTSAELMDNPNWAGPILPSVEIKVVDDAGEQLQKGELGEICIRGAMIMQGYISDSDISKDVIKDGWLKTGDLGYRDADENLFVTDRIKDIIICNNQQISANELERMAGDHPMVDEAVVLGMPDSERCEAIVMAVLPKNNQQIDKASFKQELCAMLHEYSDNIKINMVDRLPRTTSGKVNRNELRRQITLMV
ncbi:MAG: acyl--CoA ligase [Desulfatiglans sp.]|jgi:acyl-CoA synthetase (AMP-forming)/AMP-acid ligase II|nr:acyl--CoA ligase [Desulfatiglans sp.]